MASLLRISDHAKSRLRSQETTRTPVSLVYTPTINERNSARKPNVRKAKAMNVTRGESPNDPVATNPRKDAVVIAKQAVAIPRAKRPTRGSRVLN
jgi:hypothetical protein